MRTRHRVLLVLLVLCAFVVLAVGVAVVLLSRFAHVPAPVPAGWSAPASLPTSTPLPTTRSAFDSDRTGSFEIFTESTDGRAPAQLTRDDRYDSWSPRISPDRRTILFYRAPVGTHDRDQSVVSLWAVSAAGTGLVELRPAGLDGWVLQGHAEWSPDGASLVMFGGSRINPQIQVTDRLGQHPRSVTSRGGSNLDPSFTPDGKQILFVGCPHAVCTAQDYEIYRVASSGGAVQRLTTDELRDQDPAMSPDGSHLAWLTDFGGPGVGVWDVRIGDAQGRDPRRLFGDGGVTSRPEFSADSRSIFVHRVPPGGTKFDIYRIGVDGSGVTVVTAGQPGNNEYPSP